jgi:hypothetical protein
VLSDANVIEALNSQYNNVWVLVDEVRRLKTESENEDTRALCALLDQEYEFPVEFMFIDEKNELMGKLNANDDSALDKPLYSPELFAKYVTTLNES